MTTREEVIAAAKEAGIHETWNPADWYHWFGDPDDASAAYISAKRELHAGCTI